MPSAASSVRLEHEVPLGSPSSRQSSNVRKRVAPAQQVPRLMSQENQQQTHPRPGINPRLIYNDYYGSKSGAHKGAASWGMRLRNFVAAICMISFPLSIFLLPLWWHTPTYPRVVVAITTSLERLELLESTLTTLLDEKQPFIPNSIYVVVPPLTDTSPLPAFLTALTKMSVHSGDASLTKASSKHPLVQVLSPKQEYGHSTVYSTALAALEAEQRWIEASTAKADGVEVLITEHSILKETDEDGRDTRIMIWDDRYLYSSASMSTSVLEFLVQASERHPDAVLSTVGGSWKSIFRQVKRTTTHDNDLLDKPPNVLLHTLMSPRRGMISEEVEILDSSAGIIFRVGRLLPERPGMNAQLNHLQQALLSEEDDDLSILFDPDAGDVVWSGLLELHNITQILVSAPMSTSDGGNGTSTATATATTLSRRHWMSAAWTFQQHWKIWTQYRFLDWWTLTEDQIEAMECEGSYPQDCSSKPLRSNKVESSLSEWACRPNAEHCAADYGAILEAMSKEVSK